MDENRPVRLLSLDGGGIRGVSSILILKEVMRQVNVDRKLKDHLQPWQVFDLIGGTSTGGIIALMLGCLRMSVDECYEVYLKLAKTIFKPKRWKCDVFNRGLDLISAKERYDSAKMEELVMQIIKERTGSRNSMLQDPQRASSCKVFVTTVRAEDNELLLLRSYVNKQQLDTHSSSFEMWEALRATSAASTYFKEYRRGNEGYVDGAFKSNNPIFEVHNEAADLWPGRDVFLISIGTGTKPNEPLGGHVVKLARSMTRLVTATEGTWIRFHRTHKHLAEDSRLFRFSAPGIGVVDLGNYKMMGDVAMKTGTYLRDTTTARDVSACSKEMLEIQTKEYTTVHKLSKNEMDCLKLLSAAGGSYESHRLSIENPVKGTCQWFLEHKKFTKWLKESSSSLLWVTANPGCGKSVLSSFLVDVLSKKFPETSICHFFFKAGEDDRQHSHQALCSILHQIFKTHPKAIKVAMGTYSSNNATHFTQNIESLWETLCKTSDSLPSKQIICVIDALDECSEGSRNRLIDLLVNTFPQMVGSRKLLGRLKIIVTSRPWASIESRFRYLSCVRLRGEDEASSLSKDIETMVKVKVEKLKTEGTISREACSILEASLAKGADRTFLWASLVLETISHLPSRKLSAVKATLKVVPADLDQLYETALSGVTDLQASTKMLRVILAATRPLTLDELNMATSISSQHQTVQDLLDDMEPNMEYTVKSLGGFFVRVINSSVHLVHQTARDFLLQTAATRSTAWQHCLTISECHSTMAWSTVNFLLLKGWPSRGETPTADTVYASNRKLLKSLPPAAADFYAYATKSWADHTQKQEDGSQMDAALRQRIAILCNSSKPGFQTWWFMLAGTTYILKGKWDTESMRDFTTFCQYPLHFAANNGHYVTMRGLLDSESCVVTSRDNKDFDCLVAASFAQEVAVVRWLLTNFDNSCFQLGIALQGAYEMDIVRLLVDTGVDLKQEYLMPFSKSRLSWTLLQSAAIFGSKEKLKFLLSKNAGCLARAICTTAGCDRPASMQILLAAEDRRSKEDRLQNLKEALRLAGEKGKAFTRRVLLDTGVTDPEGFDLSPGLLNATMLGCSKENIEALIQDGAKDDDGKALSSRATFGDVEGVQTLLSLLEYSTRHLNEALLIFFDTQLGAELGEHLLGTIKRVLSSGNRRLSNPFPIKPFLGEDQHTNEVFLKLMSAKNARLPAARFHQAVCYAIAMDEQLALFLVKSRFELQNHTGTWELLEYLALACLWGCKAMIQHICEAEGSLDSSKLPRMLLLRAVTVSGNVEALDFILRNLRLGESRELLPEAIGKEFAAQWAMVEKTMGTSCATASPLDIATKLGYQESTAKLLAGNNRT
ncbi:ankyrin repeat protein [Colletotrichum truncatum]|uniref:Ankyrin repeat protein n=1 Tax=Colletotrichum truncatum TaxID=5467 RepID=A0ACC3YFD3_COLTU|nr:ankyrin repeat protein [Colletotrichum truncatum]KAF6788274.1 ankyrin repeat protein [Colletotrichum truncatum]